MDLGRTLPKQRTAVPTDACHRCKATGHWARDCPHRFDVRFMSFEEVEQAMNAALDTQELQEKAEESQQDFDKTDE